MSENQIRTLIGFARNAGKLAAGRTAVIKELKKNRVHLLLIAADASDKVDKLFQGHKSIKVYKYLEKQSMSEMLGRGKQVAVIAVCDAQFAKSIQQLLPPENCLTSL